jgi:hypothetical protein
MDGFHTPSRRTRLEAVETLLIMVLFLGRDSMRCSGRQASPFSVFFQAIVDNKYVFIWM